MSGLVLLRGRERGLESGDMTLEQLQEDCELGQQALVATDYLRAEQILARAEQRAWERRDFDSLSRLYLPLQEARRQFRQRCGEGEVCLDLIAQGETDLLEARHVVENYSFGQLLVAGWASTEPAREVRRLAREHELYVETFLGAVYPAGAGHVVVVVPRETDKLPSPSPGRSIQELQPLLPEHCLIFRAEELPAGSRRGDAQTFSQVMRMWERLHAPFLAEADQERDPIRAIEACRRAIEVDRACELAHQRAAEAARKLAREG